jgi:trimethylamine:corrinoid methyltransferase-like protein
MLADYVDPGLDPAIDEALQAFMTRRRTELGDTVEED